MQSTLISLAALLGVSLGASFSYNRCDSVNGPTGTAWGGDCQTANRGTPINLCGGISFTGPALTISSSYGTSRQVKVKNNGYTIQADMLDTASQPTLVAGNLARMVGYSSSLTNQTWKLEQVHFHWGRTGLTNEGSEHYLRGTAYPIEAHYVHYNSRYSSVTDAAGSGNTDALLVVGVFLQIGTTDLPIMTSLASQATTYTTTSTQQSYNVALTDLFDGSGQYWSYAGGLTTPGCNLIVTWVVMSTPKSITAGTLNLIKAVSTTPPGTSSPLISLYGNYRPLQGVGSRPVYYTGTDTACGTVTEPTFSCTTSAAAVIQPSLSCHIGLVLMALVAFWH